MSEFTKVDIVEIADAELDDVVGGVNMCSRA